MCGLAGVLLYPTQRSKTEWGELREVFTRMLVFNEERGREAAGVAVIQISGDYRLFKQPVPASELVEMYGYHKVMEAIGDGTTCIVGHTRMPTKGSRWNNANNHPLLAGHVIGIHNGTIGNDEQLFTRFGLPRSGEVDSEIIFRLLDTLDPASSNNGLDSRLNGTYLRTVWEKVQLLEGTFATLSVDLRKPTGLLVTKNMMPLCLHYEERLGALFFSSRYLFLRRAFGHSVVTEALPSGRGFYFNAQQLPDKGNEPVCSCPLKGGKA